MQKLSGRNDILAEGPEKFQVTRSSQRKVVCSSRYVTIDSEIDHVVSALKVKMDKNNNQKELNQSVAALRNITEFLNEEMEIMTTEEFRQLLLEQFSKGRKTEIPTYELTEEDLKAIHKLS